MEIEYVGEKPAIDEHDKNYAYFAKVFDAFKIEPEDESAFPVETDKKEFKKEEKETKASMSERIMQEEMQVENWNVFFFGFANDNSYRRVYVAMLFVQEECWPFSSDWSFSTGLEI